MPLTGIVGQARALHVYAWLTPKVSEGFLIRATPEKEGQDVPQSTPVLCRDHTVLSLHAKRGAPAVTGGPSWVLFGSSPECHEQVAYCRSHRDP